MKTILELHREIQFKSAVWGRITSGENCMNEYVKYDNYGKPYIEVMGHIHKSIIINPDGTCKTVIRGDAVDALAKYEREAFRKECKEIKTKTISSIENGDTVSCIDCEKDILLDGKTMIFDAEKEYISCPHCGGKRDIHDYNSERLLYTATLATLSVLK